LCSDLLLFAARYAARYAARSLNRTLILHSHPLHPPL
jgi:hypothetical protein